MSVPGLQRSTCPQRSSNALLLRSKSELVAAQTKVTRLEHDAEHASSLGRVQAGQHDEMYGELYCSVILTSFLSPVIRCLWRVIPNAIQLLLLTVYRIYTGTVS